MIICKESKYWGSKDGKELFDVWIIADSTPSPMPTSSDSVDNMDNGKGFSPGSILQVVGSGEDNGTVYFFNGVGWYEWTS